MTTDHLAELFVRLADEALSSESLVMDILKAQIEKYGVTLSETQIQALRQHMVDRGDIFRLDLSDEQEAQILEKYGTIGNIELDLNDTDLSDDKRQELAASMLDGFLEKVSDCIVEDWKSKATSLLTLEHEEQATFVQEIERTWGHALEMLEAMVSICEEKGAEINSELRQSSEFSQNNPSLIEAITRLHARGCQVANEIILLLHNGFADGAHARWRTLHEITAIANFISTRGNELAEKYLDHAIVSSYKQYESYNKTYSSLGYVAPNPQEVDELKQKYGLLMQKYGKDFRSDFGWVADVLPEPSFRKVEEATQFSHMRSFYLLANMNIHADSRSVLFRLGMPSDDYGILLTGRSIWGQGEPLQNAAYSMNNLTGTLLLLQPKLDHVAFVTATTKFTQEIVWAVDEIMHLQENETSNESV